MNKKFLQAAAFYGAAGGLVLLGMVLDSIYRLPFDKLGDVATWIGAVFTGCAFGGTIWISVQSDVRRRQEPIIALTAIFDQARYFYSAFPQENEWANDWMLEAFLKEVSLGGVYDVKIAVDTFPIDRFADFAAIGALFEMREAMRNFHSVMMMLHGCQVSKRNSTLIEFRTIWHSAETQWGVADQRLEVARRGAGL